MEWHWWVLIAIGLLILGFLKLKLFNKIKAPKDKPNKENED